MARQRIQFFLDDEQYDEVVRLAATRDSPVPELVHEIVDLGLERLKVRTQKRAKALQELTKLRQSIEARHGTYPGNPIADARADREQQVDAVLFPPDHP